METAFCERSKRSLFVSQGAFSIFWRTDLNLRGANVKLLIPIARKYSITLVSIDFLLSLYLCIRFESVCLFFVPSALLFLCWSVYSITPKSVGHLKAHKEMPQTPVLSPNVLPLLPHLKNKDYFQELDRREAERRKSERRPQVVGK
jgi:hypothetical protein